MFLDDTSCNLASINLTRFLNEDGSIDIESYKHAIHITITAQEILVSNASYPTEKIAKNSEEFRPLGLGYANLGALLMARGVPYDSPQGRDLAACLTSILTGEAYAQSARIAREIGPFNGYAVNRQPMLRVVGKHREAAYNIPTDNIEADLIGAARHAWDEAHELGARHGYRNSQATVLAPTGTISFMLDCDTTGVEPDIALVKYKKLVGGGMLKMVNGTVPAALRRLGYGETAIARHHRLHRHQRHHRGRADAARRGRRRLRLRVHAAERQALDHVAGPPPDDGRGAAVHQRRDLQDGEHAQRGDRRGHRARVHRRLEARAQGGRDLPRRQQAQPAARDQHRQDDRPSRRRSSSVRCASGFPSSAPRSRTSSRSAATRATSPSACTRTARPARSSCAWPRKARRSAV